MVEYHIYCPALCFFVQLPMLEIFLWLYITCLTLLVTSMDRCMTIYLLDLLLKDIWVVLSPCSGLLTRPLTHLSSMFQTDVLSNLHPDLVIFSSAPSAAAQCPQNKADSLALKAESCITLSPPRLFSVMSSVPEDTP